MRIRDLEEEGWNVTFTDGFGLDGKAARRYFFKTSTGASAGSRTSTGSLYVGTRATRFHGELAGIALFLEDQNDAGMLAILSDSIAHHAEEVGMRN